MLWSRDGAVQTFEPVRVTPPVESSKAFRLYRRRHSLGDNRGMVSIRGGRQEKRDSGGGDGDGGGELGAGHGRVDVEFPLLV